MFGTERLRKSAVVPARERIVIRFGAVNESFDSVAVIVKDEAIDQMLAIMFGEDHRTLIYLHDGTES